jgi:hypothetical protein
MNSVCLPTHLSGLTDFKKLTMWLNLVAHNRVMPYSSANVAAGILRLFEGEQGFYLISRMHGKRQFCFQASLASASKPWEQGNGTLRCRPR